MSTPHHHDPEGLRLPIKIDTTSSGKLLPVPLSRANRLGNRTALTHATEHAQRRRQFLMSACGAATTLLAMNQANAASGKLDGYFCRRSTPSRWPTSPLKTKRVPPRVGRVHQRAGHDVRYVR